MIWFWVLLGVLALAAAFLLIPVRLKVLYRTGEEAQVRIGWLFIEMDASRLKGLRRPGRKKKCRKKGASQEDAPPKGPAGVQERGLAVIVDLLAALKEPGGALLRRFYLYRVWVDAVVAEGDAAETGIAFGRMNALLWPLAGIAQGLVRMAKPRISVRPDFVAKEGSFTIDIRGRMAVASLLRAFLSYGLGVARRMAARKKNGETP